MQFCPKCGALMLPKKEKGGVTMVCSSCGHMEKGERLEGYSIVRKAGRSEEEVTVVEEKVEPTLPTTRVRCPSCGHDLAYWWLRQTRAGDEPSTRFYRCVRCGKVWREYA
jgi:DNA-directed RNA polymerase subunit M